MNDSGKPRAFVLITDETVYKVVKKELEESGFQVTGVLSEIPYCALILMDHEMFQLDMIEYLDAKRIEKPILLILTEMQIYSARVKAHKMVQDILVVREREFQDTRSAISGLRGETRLKEIFERYRPGVCASAAA